MGATRRGFLVDAYDGDLEDFFERRFSGRDLLTIMDQMGTGVGATRMAVAWLDQEIARENSPWRDWDLTPLRPRGEVKECESLSQKPMMDRLTAAIVIAAHEHEGQVDKGGAPYILHPLHVMLSVKAHTVENPYEREALLCAATLHDVLEDSHSDRRQLEQRIYDECGTRCLSAVLMLTREGEDYSDYIERVGRDWIARRVKAADLRHNLDPRRAAALTPDHRVRYIDALERLLAIEGEARTMRQREAS